MNHIYRVIWNASQGVWQAVTEAATARGKSTCVKAAGTAPAVNPQHLNLCIARSVLLFSIACLSAHTQAQTLPTGASIVAGQASISQSGKTMTITQSSDKLATNWQSFNIGQNHTVNFVQPSASSVALNRVTGADVSTIQGALNANGQVFLINPNGVLFTSTAQVSVGGLVASTLSLSDKDFLNGNYQFSNSGSTSAGAVINQGRITVNGDSTGAGGTVALIAARVVNTGNITADKGNVLIGAGNAVTLDLGGPVKIKVSQSSVDALIEQGGAIQADGGLIYLTAQAAGDLVASSIKHTGTSRAQTLTTGEKGQIFLMGSKQTNRIDVGGTLDASAPNGGDGGFVETSAAQVHINDNTKVTTLASGNAASGTWLIDPTDFTVSAGTTGQTSSGIGATTLQNNLANGSVSIATDNVNGIDSGNINVNSDVTWSSTSNLTLSAYNNIYINANIKNTSSGSLNLEYGQGSANGTINGTAASYRVLNGSTVTLSAGNHFSTQLGSNAANKKTYTVITDVASLQNVRNNLSTNYAIGMDINASATSGWNLVSGVYQGFNPIGTSGTNAGYAGNFAGLGHTVSNLTINRPGSSSIGLFGKLESTASVQDIGLTSLNLSANNTAGGLVATNYGAITNSYVIGTLNSLNGTLVAGLVGENFGTINRSYANIALTVTSSGTYYTAGLVGKNNGGTINNSYALGSLTLNAVGNGFGGLVGYNTGVIQRSYASLTLKVVNSGANYGIGGLVGNNTGGTISNSYSLGSLTVNNTGGNAYGGLAGYNQNSASISNSYSEVAVTAPASQPSYGAGLVGLNSAQISNSYSTGSVSGNQAGGLVASNSGAITNSYSISSVTGTGSNGLVVINGGTVTNSYWDTTTSGKSTSAAGTGLTTAQFKSIANYSAWTTTSQTDGSGWVMVDTAGAINSGNNLAGRPILAMEYSNQIRTTNQLQLMALSPTSSYTLSQTINASSMGSPVLLQGGALDLGGYTLTTANYKQTSGTLSNGTLTASSGFDLQAGTVSANLTGAAALNKSTSNTVTLSGTSTYTGDTTISDGTLVLSGTGSIAASSGVTTSGSGVLDISGTTSGASVASLSGTSTATTGVVLGSQTLTLSNASGTYAGVIGGTGGLTLTAGLEALTGANTYTGDTTINGGKLQLGNNTAGSLSGSSKVMVANGATFLLYQATGANFTNTVIDQGTVTFTPSGTLTASGAISGSGSLIQSGTGTTTLTGANTYSGSTTVNIGTLQVGNGTTGSLNATSAVTVASGATLRLNEATGSSFANTVIDNGTVDFAQSGTLTASGVISGTGALTQSGTGKTTLTNANTYNGTTTVSGGTLALSGTGSIAASSGVTTSDSGVLDISGTTSGATLVSLTGTSTAATGVVLGSQTLTLSNASGNYAGVIGGTGGLTLAAGTETLSGTNTYQGSTSITTGSLIIQNDNPSTASSSFSGSGKLVIESSNSSFATGFDSSSWALGSLGGLRIGKSGNTADLTIKRALSMTGDINLFGGNVSINQAITNPSNTLSITATGNVTQSAALVSNTLVILGANTVTLNNSNNQVNTLAATGVGTFNFLNNGALSIGQSGGVSGVASSAAVNISTRTGNLSVDANITTTDTSTSAVTLNAGKDAIAGTSSGGNLLMANGKTITVGTGGRAVLYTGSVNDSTGLSSLVGSGTGHYRYNSDESETNYSTVLGTGLYAVYREKPTVILSGSQAAIYGDALPTLQATVTGTKNGDSNTDLSMVSPSYSASSHLNAGQYGITSTNLAGLGYAVQNTTFTVNARPITVSGVSTSRVYGDSNPALSYTTEAAGTSRGLVAGDSLIGAVSTSATSASSKGSYDITQGSLTNTNNSNYDISYTNGTLTVNARPITVSGNNASRVYGDSNPSLTYTTEAAGTSRGLVAGDNLGLSGSLVTDATASSNKGTYDIAQGSLSSTNTNYDMSYAKATLTVNARPITVSGVSTSRVYGDSNPALSYTTEAAGTSRGLVSGDSLIGAVSTSATSASSKGSYDITQGSLTNTNNSNYDISYTNGTLTVHARPITVSGVSTNRVYGDSNPALSYTTEAAGTSRGLVAGDNLGLSGSLVTDATAFSSKGTYDIAQGSLSSSNTNYDMSYAKATLTVNARPITVSGVSTSRVYGDSNPSLTYTVQVDQGVANTTSRGLASLDGAFETLSGSVTTAATSASNKGIYDITQGSLTNANNDNYAITYSAGTLTINARPISLVGTRTYDGSTVVKASIFSLSNLVNNEDLVLSGSGSVASPLVAAGTQEVNLGSLALNDSNNGTASNYTLLGGSYLATITGPNVSPAISTASITIAQQIAKVSTASTNAPTLGLPLAPTPASAPAIAVNTATSGGSSVQTSTVSTAVTTNTNDEPTVQASAATPATTVITVSAPLAQPQVQAEVFVGGLLLVRAPANTNLSENNVALLQAGPSNVVRDSGRDANGFMRIKVTSGGIRD